MTLVADRGPDEPSSGLRPSGSEATEAPSWWRREGAAFVEIFALSGFAVAQPVLDLFGRTPSQFVFRNAEAADIVRFALLVAGAVPLALWLVEATVGLVSGIARRVVHLAIAAVLVWVFAVQAGRSLVSGWPLMALAVVGAVLGTVLVARAAAARLWLRFASVAPVAFVALFLFASDTAPLVAGDDVEVARTAVGSPAPVVMLVLDELPLTAIMRSDGTVDDELYPNLAELAAGSTFFRNTTAVSSSTGYAVSSIATGTMPRDGAAPLASDHPESLFTLLGDTYAMKVTESTTRLCPTDLCEVDAPPATVGSGSLLGDAVDVMRARLSLSGDAGDVTAGFVEAEADAEAEAEAEADVDAEADAAGSGEDVFADFHINQPSRFRQLLDGLEDDSATLHYLHILLPHVPYRYLPSGARYEPPAADSGRIEDDWAEEEWFPTLARQRLQLQVAYLDGLVGELLATLRERDLYDEALVVLTADHGISFHAGRPIRGIEGQPLTEPTLGELAWVPLLVKEPGQRDGRVSDANVLTVDVLPTIADVLDVDIPWEIDGTSALGAGRDDEAKPFHGADVHAFGVASLDPISIDPETGRESVADAAVDRFLDGGSGAGRFWRIGPHADLVGTDVGADADLRPVEATLRDPSRYDLADDPTRVPALVRLGVAADLVGEQLAVAVNGVVGAVAPAVPTDGGAEVVVMVDDALLRTGPNDVTVHRLAG
ncbi:sulfatase-like hydrolase/transferase [Iamia sp. SCSIO 61187]|uniref:sulfatase-like hydrolase/transferase n=1 Tax=Iamia sp. SCSIO 61187 TaxID=2722752 RepID=UPI001C628360|nr:sulfatase-like hydrolase/transferase [Iamia sp. SCSIO 61187]QYG93205.1 sulfatase-like hydrolase/transferase [Iamia sp. SCSIO 61187]